MMRWLRGQTFWQDVEPYFQLNQIIYKWINDLMFRLDLSSELSINLADLFPNATRLNELLQAALSIDEETALQMIVSTTIKPELVCNQVSPYYTTNAFPGIYLLWMNSKFCQEYHYSAPWPL